MTSIRSFRFSNWLTITLFLLSAVVGFSVQARAQRVPSVHAGGVEITGLPDDWTHHHVVFANPGTEQEALDSGHHVQWLTIVNDPRYVIQQLKRNLPVEGPAADEAAYRVRWMSDFMKGPIPMDPFGFGPHGEPIRRPIPQSEIQRDWSMTSGGAGGLLPNHYPAKYGFSATTQESCTDYIVFPTGIVGSIAQATVMIYNNLYKGTCGSTVPGVLLSINTGGLANTSPVLSGDGTQVSYVQTTSSGSVTATLTNRSTSFRVTTGTLSSSDVGSIVSATAGIPAGDTIATVIDSTHGTLTTAANAGGSHALTITGIAQLVLLKIGTGGGTAVSSPVSPRVTTTANYRSCTAPCYTTFNFSYTGTTVVGDSNSAPFYIYGIVGSMPDILYVGDNLGFVHKYTGVFLGTPAEVTSGWPAQASTETLPALNSPIYDSSSGNIFVGDTGGFLHQFAVGTTPGTVHTSGRLAYNTGGLTDPPILDSTSGTDYAFQFVGYSDDTMHDRPSYINRFPATTALSGNFGTSIWYPNESGTSRPAGTSTLQYVGTFDNTYYNGTGNTGNIYACADGVIYQIPMATINNATPIVNTFSTPTSGVANCSPATEFFSGSTDWLFMSVAANGNATVSPTCAGACVYNYNVTTSTNKTSSPVDGLSALGGTSGIAVDNAASGGGSEIYFTSHSSETCGGNGTVGNGSGSCAVQATQSGLQ